MPQEQTKELCERTRGHLRDANRLLNDFLDQHNLRTLTSEESERSGNENFLREFLADLRRLAVFCDLGYEKVSLVLRRAKFNEEFAAKVLNEVFRSCVNNFYCPRNEVYEEDGRYSYTNRDAFRFREEPPESLKELTFRLSRIFEKLRDELEYYETDPITRLRMQRHSATS
ncbi:uncharacterized protein DUF3907 [Melghirimyces profundicolus]|uniref:Uncharacterized protein DUF3907 n=1 Tax=Melghirimyces profundicolus TaxID=1242148 RepID=A0A2T6BGG8_9BACL|nr:DUF3907 family protein [Melghirimyces profundicolus]PTX55165.1 uncharacterized protein DUF3907 [Melghirimyces profundicolus]